MSEIAWLLLLAFAFAPYFILKHEEKKRLSRLKNWRDES